MSSRTQTTEVLLRWKWDKTKYQNIQKYTYTCLTTLCPGLPGWVGTRMVKPIWILLKQATVSGSGISWAICKSAPRSRQITMPAPHYSVFYRPDVFPAAQPTASKHCISKYVDLLTYQSCCKPHCLQPLVWVTDASANLSVLWKENGLIYQY